MFAPSKIKSGARAVALAFALAGSSFSAHAVLERIGPVSTVPSEGGFPSWYQDTTGISMQFCGPKNDSELAGGWCLLLPGNVNATPETFPSEFFIEHFYFAGTAIMDHPTAGGAKSLLVVAQEATFDNGFDVVPGEQVVFSRIRVRLTPAPVTGTYRFIHPYGEEVVQGVAGERISFTEDVGVTCVGTFECSIGSRLGPFLLPSATPGGAEMPALTAANPTPDTDPSHFNGAFTPTPYPGTGDAYIADPARIGPVTGSSLPDFVDSNGNLRNHNIFRIEGPPGSALGVDPATGAVVDWAETTNFNLAGRLYAGAMTGNASVSRASYTRNANGLKLDVLASGSPATGARLPGQPAPESITPALTFFDAPCAGTVDALGTVRPPFSAPLGATETQMFNTGESYWGQARPAALPAAVCVKHGNARDAFGNIVPAFLPKNVTDEVTVTQALYDPATTSLTVAAVSSDETEPPALKLAYQGYSGDLAGGQIVVPNMVTPPSKVRVLSSASGTSEYQVKTVIQAAPAPDAPVAVADAYAYTEDSGAHILDILANDLNVTGATVNVTSAPSFGAAVVNADGTVTYTANPNAYGADSFTYKVTVGALVSGSATVSLDLAPVNDAPVAVDDTATATQGTPLQINVLANDTDPDGPADLSAAILVGGAPAGTTITGGAGGIFTFNTLQAGGPYVFNYRAQDQSLTASANTGQVTVTVIAAEQALINRNQYVVRNSQLTVEGTTTPAGNQTVTILWLDNAGNSLGTAATTVAAAGRWKIGKLRVTKPALATRIVATTPAAPYDPANQANTATLILK
ncbi:MAG: cadherin-like domain-containing protein [Burkholderiales bacterium]|nr:cadherin-like domain-containing protein [Burkholderiales bacterium]